MTAITKRGSKRQQIKSLIVEAETPPTPPFSVVTELPLLIPIGSQVLFNGTLYRGLLPSETSLPACTPWPVKGYKEIIIEITQYGSNVPTLRTILNETESTFEAAYSSPGIYSINNSIALCNPSDIIVTLSPLYNDNPVHWAKGNYAIASITVVYSSYQPSYFMISSRDYAGVNTDWNLLYPTKTVLSARIFPPRP